MEAREIPNVLIDLFFSHQLGKWILARVKFIYNINIYNFDELCYNTNSLFGQRTALLAASHLAEPYLCEEILSLLLPRDHAQRTRWIAKWKELPLKRLLNDQQLYAAATAGVRRKQGKMPATNKQEISCRYVHVHALFSMCVLIDVNCIFYQ